MAVFTTNQVRHFYVANSYNTSVNSKGAIGAFQDADGKVYFKYYGEGGLLRSDLMDPSNGIRYTITDPKKRKLNQVKVTLAEGTTITPGQDYVIRVKITNYYTPASEPAVFQFGVVRATNAMKGNMSEFYSTLATSLAKNVNKGEVKLINVTSDSEGITITEVAQTAQYKRGEYSVKPVTFEVFLNEVNACLDAESGIYEVMTWGEKEVTTTETNAVVNGYTIADMEHFYMGERGDVYRNNVTHGWDTKYMVNPESEYYTMDIHFAFTDEGTSSYRSEKDIVIVSTDKAVLTNIESALNTFTGKVSE